MQSRSLQRRSSQPITWLILTNETLQEKTKYISTLSKQQKNTSNITTLVQSPLDRKSDGLILQRQPFYWIITILANKKVSRRRLQVIKVAESVPKDGILHLWQFWTKSVASVSVRLKGQRYFVQWYGLLQFSAADRLTESSWHLHYTSKTTVSDFCFSNAKHTCSAEVEGAFKSDARLSRLSSVKPLLLTSSTVRCDKDESVWINWWKPSSPSLLPVVHPTIPEQRLNHTWD